MTHPSFENVHDHWYPRSSKKTNKLSLSVPLFVIDASYLHGHQSIINLHFFGQKIATNRRFEVVNKLDRQDAI